MQEGRGSPSGTYERQAIWLLGSRSVSRGHMYEWPHDTWEMKELMCNMKSGEIKSSGRKQRLHMTHTQEGVHHTLERLGGRVRCIRKE